VDTYELAKSHQMELRTSAAERARARRSHPTSAPDAREARRPLLWFRRPARPLAVRPGFTADPIAMPAVPAVPTAPVSIRTISGELGRRPRPSGSPA
jgi:hypothetical protein